MIIHVPTGHQLPGAFPTEPLAAGRVTELIQKTGNTFVHVERLVPKSGYWPLSTLAPPSLHKLLWDKYGAGMS